MADWRDAIDGFIDEHAEMLSATRRHLHSHPEPSREEFETAAYVAGRLEQVGLPYRVITSRRGVITEPAPEDPSARVALRADMDALRLQDAKDVPYRSTRDGVMHACGHDAHTTIVLGACLALWQCRERLPWPVPWRAIFQPAEEVGDGALEMIREGAVEGVRAIVTLHVDPDALAGRVGQKPGVLTAFCEEFHVIIQGQGGHAARPHQAIDPIGVAVQFVSAVYQAVPRAIDARDPVVVTFGSIHGGASPNVIPDHVVLSGTIRALSLASATRVGERLRRIALGLTEATGALVEVALRRGLEGVVNDPVVTATCVRAATELLGPDHVDLIPLPSMGGEDFSGYLAHAPGCLLRLGVAREGAPRHFLHSPHFDIDERALAIGAKLLARCAVLLARDKAAW